MLLNPSHTVTFSGLPPDLLDAYVRYKKGTRAITAWLLQHGSEKYRNLKRLQITDMVALAEIVSGKRLPIPETVDFYFRETISARQYLSKSFRKQEPHDSANADTINHEHFTSSLSQIYRDLCQCCGRARVECRKSLPSQDTASDKSLGNRFGALPVHNTRVDNNQEEDDSSAPTSCLECSTSVLNECSGIADGHSLLDDHFGKAVELIAVLQEMHAIRTAILDCWSQTGPNGVPTTVAACVTNVGIIVLRELASRLRDIDENSNLETIHRNYHSFQRFYRTGNDEHQDGEPSWHRLLGDVKKAWCVLEHHLQDHQVPLQNTSSVQKPSEHIPRPDRDPDQDHLQCLHKLVSNVNELIERHRAVFSADSKASIITEDTPLITEIANLKAFSGDRSNRTAELYAALILDLLLKSYQTHVYNPSSSIPANSSGLRLKTASTNPRIESLRLAASLRAPLAALLEAHPPTAKSTFPCRCPQTLAYHLEALNCDLYSFSHEKCWDLLHQSPWVAGSHMLEMSRRTTYYGLKLMRYRNFVAAILHVYNALRCTAGLRKVLLLEDVCDELAGLFWNDGERARGSFRAAYVRWQGGRLKFNKGRRGHRHKERSWCMIVPGHGAKESTGLGVGLADRNNQDGMSRKETVGKGSLCHRIMQRGFLLDDKLWNEICVCASRDGGGSAKSVSNLTEKVKDATKASNISSLPSSNAQRLQHLQRALSKEVNNKMSLANVNYFTLYNSCVRVIEQISDAGHTDPRDRGIRCLCFVETILAAAERVEKGRRINDGAGSPSLGVFSKVERKIIEMVEGALGDVFWFDGGNNEVESLTG